MKRRYKIILYAMLLIGALGATALLALLWGIPRLLEKQLPFFVSVEHISVNVLERLISLQNIKITGDDRCSRDVLISIKQLNLRVNPKEVLITGIDIDELFIAAELVRTCGWPREPETLPAGDDVVAWHNLDIKLSKSAVLLNKNGKLGLTNLSGSMQLTRKEDSFAVRDIQLTATDSFSGQHTLSGTGTLPRDNNLEHLKTELAIQSRFADLAISARSLKLPVRVLKGSANIRTGIKIDQKLLSSTINLKVQNLELKNLRQTPLFSIDPVTMLPLIEDSPGVHILNVRIQGKLDDPKFDPVKKIQQEFTRELKLKINQRVTRLKNTLSGFRNLLPLP